MATALVTVDGSITSTPTGAFRRVGPLSITSATANSQVQRIVLQSGANTITVPATPATTGCVIQLPSTNTAVTTLKGVTGDTGIAIGKTGFLVLTWDVTAAPSAFDLTSAATQTGLATEIAFF